MKIQIKKGVANGTISAPTSKSMAHRLLISAALAEGESRVRSVTSCDDVLATIDCLSALGVECEWVGEDVIVKGKKPIDMTPTKPLFARESGSTLRFIIPIALSTDKSTVFYGFLLFF